MLAVFLWLFVAHGLRFPVGPDAPAYLWWMRAAGHDGLSVIGHRPGTPALLLTVAGALHLSPVAVTAGLEVAVAVAVGLGSAALARACEGATRAAWTIAGGLAGLFAVHLASGYLSNLFFAAAFLAACVAVASADDRRAAVAGSLLLGAGGLTHPQFFVPGAAILAVVAVWAGIVRHDRAELARAALPVVGGGLLLGGGLLAMLLGPDRLAVDTSRDGFLRRAGLGDVLRGAYVDRFVHRWARYVQWVSLPLAGGGYLKARGTGGRILRAWLVVIVVGIPVGLATGLFPADRLVTFGYAVPILAAFGVIWLFDRLRVTKLRTPGAWITCAVLLFVMGAGSLIAWRRQAPFIDANQVRQLEALNGVMAVSPPGTPVIVRVDTGDETVTFAATEDANIVRAGVPPDRIADVWIVVPSFAAAGQERSRLATVSQTEAREAIAAAGGRGLSARLTAFAPLAPGETPDGIRIADGVWISKVGDPAAIGGGGARGGAVDPLRPSSPGGIVLASLAVLALLWIGGYGWARAAFDPVAAAALAPAVGLAAFTVVGVAAGVAGVPLGGSMGPTILAVLAGGGGYLARRLLVRERRDASAPTA